MHKKDLENPEENCENDMENMEENSDKVWTIWKKGKLKSGFQDRGVHLEKLRRAEGGAKILGYFVWKITILRQKILFFSILGGRAPGAPPWIRPW
jgi:hypothetical protein